METQAVWGVSTTLPEFPAISSDVSVDVAIIGGGLTGITAAYLLKREGVKVALLERARCGAGDTGHTTAHLTYVTDERLHTLVKNFGKDAAKAFWEAGAAAIDEIDAIVRATGSKCEFRWVPGFLHASLKNQPEGESKDVESLEKDAELARELGFKARFLKTVPLVNRPGVEFSNQAKFHPLKYLGPLLETVQGRGSYVFENTGADEISDEPLTIRCGRFKVRCEYLMIATHNPLLGKTGLVKGTLFQSKLALYTSYVLGLSLPRGRAPEALFWDTTDPYYYIRTDRHEQDDYVIFGGEDCKTGQEADPEAVFRRLEQKCREVLPEGRVRQRWLGQVVETDDGLPFIGENEGRQFIATGFCGNGFTLGTLSATMMRDRYLRRKNPWFELFRVDRKKFHGGAWRYMTENLDYPYYLLRGRLGGAEGESADELKIGEGKILKLDGRKVAAYRDETGKVSLASAVCTHLGCIVRWNAADKTWDCPCHGSRFLPSGEVYAGPAEDPLEKVQTSG